MGILLPVPLMAAASALARLQSALPCKRSAGRPRPKDWHRKRRARRKMAHMSRRRNRK